MPFAWFTGIKSEQWQSLLIALIALSLTACASKSIPPQRPTVPPLPARVVQSCALPIPLPDGDVSTLIAALLDAWEGMTECEVKRAGAVQAYEAARAINNEVMP